MASIGTGKTKQTTRPDTGEHKTKKGRERREGIKICTHTHTHTHTHTVYV